MSDQLKIIEENLEQAKMYYAQMRGRQQMLNENRARLEKLIEKKERLIDLLTQVKLLLHKASEYAREQARQQIETMVTHCLQSIFDKDIQFKIEIEQVRGRPEAEFYVISEMEGIKVKTKPQEARGGGIVDVISLALRIALLQIHTPPIHGPLLLDEPAKHVSSEYIINLAEFISRVSSVFQRQIIMVTHNTHLSEIADKAYRVEQDNGISRVQPLSLT